MSKQDTRPRALRKCAVAIMAALLLPLTLAAQCDAPTPAKTPAPSAHCEEDRPCWNCSTMGNRRCDPNGADL
ncbi:hypothetical protein AB0383_19750 [Amycolatopsis sp. NPDC051373]|uniref:hypothetical protein n=1 Tax=Amycolatopsis sp. NPDC051373 TaxID=3155801 RepID=UPI00344EF663